MPQISVIMSVYREPLEYIKLSVNSILEQDFKDLELIIVVDNPRLDHSIKEYLKSLPENVRVIYNDANMGLAMSMNKAAALAEGKYLARMDADDISVRSRLKIQFDAMEDNHYDLTCGGRKNIDENGAENKRYVKKMNHELMIKNLPYEDVIFHPTVMMKKAAFDDVGGYRDFPCAQDYDLWLRFYEKGKSLHYINQTLLYYRIWNNTISQSNGVQQAYTTCYIKKLYRERKKYGMDSFSEENYLKFLDKCGVNNPKYCQKALDGKKIKSQISVLKFASKTKWKAYVMMLRLFLFNEYYRNYYFRMLLARLRIR